MNLFATQTLFLLLCAIILTAGCAGDAQAQEYSKAYTVGAHPTVHVNALDARVRVITSDDPKVSFKVDYDDRGGTPFKVASRQEGNLVELRANDEASHPWGFIHGDRHVSIEVRMPHSADLELQTSNGDIEAAGLNGTVSLHTSNGPIHAQQLSGSIDLGSSNGAIVVGALKGKLRIYTSNGAISADDLEGSCELVTSNGRISAAGRFEVLNLRSSNGGIVARAESGSKVAAGWHILTSNASIELSVPPDLKATLDAVTSNAGVRADLPVTVQGDDGKSQLHGVVNGGGPEVSIHTSNGRIHLGTV